MGSAVGLTYALMLVSMGVGDDSHERMLHEAIAAAGGDVIVNGAGYWDTRGSDIVIADADEVLRRVEAAPDVAVAIPRVLVNGLVSTSSGARPVLLSGIDPARELPLRDIADDLTAGTLLTGDEEAPIVLGIRLVDELELELGDRVVLTASQPDGELTRALFHLTGILETGSRELDAVLGYTTLAAARGAVGMEGMLTQIGVLTPRSEDPDFAREVRDALGDRAADLEVLSWPEAVPEMVGFVELDDAFGYLYLVVIFLVVMLSITNTFLMAVMERVRELGLLSALGLRGERIGRLLLYETIPLIGLSMAVGFALGFGAHLAIGHWGIPVAAWGLDEMEISGVDISDLVIYSVINPAKWIAASVFVAGATLASAIYPAWKATRIAPAEAMRFFE